MSKTSLAHVRFRLFSGIWSGSSAIFEHKNVHTMHFLFEFKLLFEKRGGGAIFGDHNLRPILLHLEPHDYRNYYVNIDLRHQYGISVTEWQTFPLAKRPHLRGATRNGCFRRVLSRSQ